MIPVVLGVGAALAVLVLVWLVTSAGIRYRRGRAHRREAQRLARVQTPRPERAPDTRARESAVFQDAERALAEARREAESIVAAAQEARGTELDAAREAAEKIRGDAMRTAAATVRAAEEQAAELVTAAERRLAEAAEGAAETQRELVSLLRDLLSQARADDGQRPANLYPLGGPHDARADAPDQAR
jgi:hypothetical protein